MTKHALGKRIAEFLARHRGEREKTAHWLVRASIRTGATDVIAVKAKEFSSASAENMRDKNNRNWFELNGKLRK